MWCHRIYAKNPPNLSSSNFTSSMEAAGSPPVVLPWEAATAGRWRRRQVGAIGEATRPLRLWRSRPRQAVGQGDAERRAPRRQGHRGHLHARGADAARGRTGRVPQDAGDLQHPRRRPRRHPSGVPCYRHPRPPTATVPPSLPAAGAARSDGCKREENGVCGSKRRSRGGPAQRIVGFIFKAPDRFNVTHHVR